MIVKNKFSSMCEISVHYKWKSNNSNIRAFPRMNKQINHSKRFVALKTLMSADNLSKYASRCH